LFCLPDPSFPECRHPLIEKPESESTRKVKNDCHATRDRFRFLLGLPEVDMKYVLQLVTSDAFIERVLQEKKADNPDYDLLSPKDYWELAAKCEDTYRRRISFR
jgi:hypothetical protein